MEKWKSISAIQSKPYMQSTYKNQRKTLSRVSQIQFQRDTIKVYKLIDLAAIFSYFPIGPIFDIKQTHLRHGLLKIEEKHGLVESISVDDVLGFGAIVQCLIRKQNPVLSCQSFEVEAVEIVSRGVEGLLFVVAGTACFGKRLREIRIQSWIRLA